MSTIRIRHMNQSPMQNTGTYRTSNPQTTMLKNSQKTNLSHIMLEDSARINLPLGDDLRNSRLERPETNGSILG